MNESKAAGYRLPAFLKTVDTECDNSWAPSHTVTTPANGTFQTAAH
jgi:hypothetical protein